VRQQGPGGQRREACTDDNDVIRLRSRCRCGRRFLRSADRGHRFSSPGDDGTTSNQLAASVMITRAATDRRTLRWPGKECTAKPTGLIRPLGAVAPIADKPLVAVAGRFRALPRRVGLIDVDDVVDSARHIVLARRLTAAYVDVADGPEPAPHSSVIGS
jgi:hypothetical protein